MARRCPGDGGNHAMATTTELIKLALGTEKFSVLANAIDLLDGRFASILSSQPIDAQIETIDFDQLAAQNGISPITLRKKINSSLGRDAVVRPGKKLVIRKTAWLEYLQRLEAAQESEDD
jgi:hypothetical protein